MDGGDHALDRDPLPCQSRNRSFQGPKPGTQTLLSRSGTRNAANIREDTPNPRKPAGHIHAAGDLSKIEGIGPEQQGFTQRSSLYSPKG